MTHSHPTNPISTSPATPNRTPETPLTPSLFDQIQSLFLLKNTPLQTLYTQFQLSLTVLFSILHDHTTQTLRRAIDEHTYLCAQRAHLELILETENVAIALAKTENPTQEQRRRLGTLNATLKTSFKHLQQLRDTLLHDNNTTDHTEAYTELGEPHTTHKPTHTKRTTPRRAPTRATTNTNTAPTPTSTPPNPNTQSTYSNTSPTTPHTNSTQTTTPNTTSHTHQSTPHTAPTPTQHTPTPTPKPELDPRWLPVLPLLTPEEQRIIPHIEPDTAEDLFQLPPQHIATALRHSLSLHPEALNLDPNLDDPQTIQPTS